MLDSPVEAVAFDAKQLAANLAQHRKQKPEEPLPQSPEMEQAVLGAILAAPETGFPIFEQLGRLGFFFNPITRELYSRARKFYQENGRVDLITFTAELTDSGDISRLGGPSFVTEIFVSNAQTSSDWLRHYIGELRERYIRRQIITRAFAIASKARSEDVDELLGDLESSVLDLRRTSVTSDTLVDAAFCLNGHKPEMPAQLVSRVLHQGSKMIVGGTSKGRKSMTLIDLGVSVATGSDFWGFHTRQGSVCYVNFEIQDAFFWYRVDEVCKAKEVELGEGVFKAWNLRGRANQIQSLAGDLLKVLQAYKFALVVVDPIYKALGKGDENKAGDVAFMLNEIERIAVETGAAIAFGAHYSKGNQALKEHIDRIGGSGVFARDPDSILTMTAHEEEECFTVESTLRNFPPLKSFVVRWAWPLFVRDVDLDPANLKRARGNKSGQFEQKYNEDLLLELLVAEGALEPKRACAILKESKDVSRRTVYNMKEKLEKANKVITNSEGKWSAISE